ncbi:MAG: hypothetical protein AAGI48_11660 [Verrucomicrobiota bacterium]
MAVFHLLRIAARILILVVVAALGFTFYLAKRSDSQDFKDGLKDRFAESMAASDAELKDFRRDQGEGRIRRVGAVGTSMSFFETLEASNLSFKMGFLDGLHGDWEAGIVVGNWIDAHVKAGANSPEEAAAAAESLFKQRKGFDVTGLEFSKARVSWGYDRRLGKIEGSTMNANRVSEGWRFNFNGGTFTQNWIRDFEIVHLEMLLTPSKLIVEKGILKAGDGRVEFEDVEVEGGMLPELSGRLVLKHVPIEFIVPAKVAERVSGRVSGELELSGSTNSTEGIGMEGRIDLENRDYLQLRSSFPLLDALDVVDVFNSYKRVGFESGGFNLKTGGGEMLISGLNLDFRDVMSLQGRLSVRFPSAEEAARRIGDNPATIMTPMVRETEEERERKRKISLRRAAEERRRAIEEGEGETSEQGQANTAFFDELAARRDSEDVLREARLRELNTLIFEGGFRITIPGDAFERSRALRERYPVDQATGRIGIDVPLSGTLPELTLRQAEEILNEGGRDEEDQ